MDFDTTVLTAVGTAITALFAWLGPRVAKILDAVPSHIESQSQVAVALASLSESFAILSRIFSASQIKLHQKEILLLVEDAVFDARLISELLHGLLKRHDLVLTVAATIEEACLHVYKARVVILDLMLPDSTEAKIKALINLDACPVVIHSASPDTAIEYGAFAVVGKWSDGDTLIREVDRAIMSTIPRE